MGIAAKLGALLFLATSLWLWRQGHVVSRVTPSATPLLSQPLSVHRGVADFSPQLRPAFQPLFLARVGPPAAATPVVRAGEHRRVPTAADFIRPTCCLTYAELR